MSSIGDEEDILRGPTVSSYYFVGVRGRIRLEAPPHIHM